MSNAPYDFGNLRRLEMLECEGKALFALLKARGFCPRDIEKIATSLDDCAKDARREPLATRLSK